MVTLTDSGTTGTMEEEARRIADAEEACAAYMRAEIERLDMKARPLRSKLAALEKRIEEVRELGRWFKGSRDG